MKTRETIEAQSTEQSPANTRKGTRGVLHPKMRVAMWKPGQSGNPSGRPKQDMSQIIARAVIENNAEAIYKAYARQLLKGGAFAFQVISERGYGKLKETRDTGSEFNDIPDSELQQAIDNILAKLGLARAADAAAKAGVAQARAAKTPVETQDS